MLFHHNIQYNIIAISIYKNVHKCKGWSLLPTTIFLKKIIIYSVILFRKEIIIDAIASDCYQTLSSKSNALGKS